jgi:hypothetical protein
MLDEFLDAQAKLTKGGPRWWWDHVDLTDEQRNAVLEAVGRPDVSDRAVKMVLAKWGVTVTQAQIAHLRRKVQAGG